MKREECLERGGAISGFSDTPHGPRPGGFSGDACSNELRYRLKAVSPPTVRMPGL
jgi:hypothetical protein